MSEPWKKNTHIKTGGSPGTTMMLIQESLKLLMGDLHRLKHKETIRLTPQASR